MRAALRRLFAEVTGYAARWSSRKVGLALVYHRVGDPEGDPRSELVPALATATFEGQLRHLRSRYRTVTASDLPDAVANRRRGERFPVAITFDDDLASHRAVAGPVLRRLGLTATFFLSGASLEGPSRFWWERLQDAIDRELDIERSVLAGISVAEPTGQGRERIHGVAATIQELPSQQHSEVSRRLEALVGPDPSDTGMRADDVAWLVESGFEVGFHTLTHPYMPTLDDRELEEALTAGRAELAEVTGRPLRSIAYPHGGTDARIQAAARARGFDTGYTLVPGAVTETTDPLAIGRSDPRNDSGVGFPVYVAWRLRQA
jgi:peptidoglycan/xylan/chitin deacetylase (PgdA/CDA1 family)